jgi:hypothetical protein
MSIVTVMKRQGLQEVQGRRQNLRDLCHKSARYEVLEDSLVTGLRYHSIYRSLEWFPRSCVLDQTDANQFQCDQGNSLSFSGTYDVLKLCTCNSTFHESVKADNQLP